LSGLRIIGPMKKNTFVATLLLLVTVFSQSAFAQIVKPDTITRWKKKLVFNFNINQAAFSSNWKAGGINSVGFNSSLNYRANYTNQKITWANEFDFLYGFVSNSGQGYRKTMDRMFFDTKIGYKVHSNWDVFTSLNFLSQFSEGYKYDDDDTRELISDIFAPAFVTSAWGVQYKPADFFYVRISPFAPRVTILRNNNGRFDAVDTLRPYGVEVGHTTRYEWLAFQLIADFNKDIFTNMNLKWRYMMFANYETLQANTIDHRFDLMLSARVNRFISVGLGAILVYDFDQDSGAQYSQAFNIGFRYSFQNFEE
jgi:hypothetical protein